MDAKVGVSLFRRIEMMVEVEDGGRNILLRVMTVALVIFNRVDPVIPSPIDGRGVEKLSIQISINEPFYSGLKLPKFLILS